jgi:hypothetical protein
MWLPLVLCESCKGSNFAFAAGKERVGVRRAELVRTLQYDAGGRFVFVQLKLKFKGSGRNCYCD